MKTFTEQDVSPFTLPERNSHKGQNGRVLIIGGSHFFHAASLWALTVSSRFVDLVHYASVPENQAIVQKAKEEFRNGIVVPRQDIERYIEEDDVILIGPGMVREEQAEDYQQTIDYSQLTLLSVLHITEEGKQTRVLTEYLLRKYPGKQWVIDAGALQVVDVSCVPKGAILTPHHKEFELLVSKAQRSYPHIAITEHTPVEEQVFLLAKTLQCTVLLKGEVDYICSEQECVKVEGGNSGMTKGGTGDVLAGLVAGFAAKHDPFFSACCASFINKRSADELYKIVGPFFNASDLADQIPKTLAELLKKYSHV